MKQYIKCQIERCKKFLHDNPTVKTKIVSYVSTFLAFFVPAMTLEGQAIISSMYDNGVTWAAFVGLVAVAWRTGVKSLTRATLCWLLPGVFCVANTPIKEQNRISPSQKL